MSQVGSLLLYKWQAEKVLLIHQSRKRTPVVLFMFSVTCTEIGKSVHKLHTHTPPGRVPHTHCAFLCLCNTCTLDTSLHIIHYTLTLSTWACADDLYKPRILGNGLQLLHLQALYSFVYFNRLKPRCAESRCPWCWLNLKLEHTKAMYRLDEPLEIREGPLLSK